MHLSSFDLLDWVEAAVENLLYCTLICMGSHQNCSLYNLMNGQWEMRPQTEGLPATWQN
jgi:hypothetical protein